MFQIEVTTTFLLSYEFHISVFVQISKNYHKKKKQCRPIDL